MALLKSLLFTLSLSGLSLASLSEPFHALSHFGPLRHRQNGNNRGSGDPCADIAGQTYVVPSKVLACLNSFPYNPSLRNNIVSVISKTLNFHTSTNYQLQAPPPFRDVHVDIQAELKRIGGATYDSDFALHKDVSAQVKRLNDGHCVYISYCYDSLYVTYLPFPLVNLNHGWKNLQQDVFIAPEAYDVASKEFAPFLAQWQQMAGFNFTKYSGAKVLLIDDLPPAAAIEASANTAGGYQSHATRQNSFFSSYILSATEWGYRMGDFAARSLPPTSDHVKLTVVLANSTRMETIKVPFISRITTGNFTNGADLWNKNCLATASTNGVDYFAGSSNSTAVARSDAPLELVDPSPPKFAEPIAPRDRRHPISSFIDVTALADISLPPTLNPPAPISGSGTAKFYTLDIGSTKVGVLALGSFSTGAGYDAWFQILKTGLDALKSAGVTKLVVDVTNNGGGYICVAHFLHRYLAGPKPSTEPQAGFDTKARYNSLASNITQKVVTGGVPERGYLLYDPVNWKYGNSSGTFPETYNWFEPAQKEVVNGRQDAFSQKVGDECQPFPLEVPSAPLWPMEDIGIVGNGRCASSCAIFTITMSKKEGVKTAVYGGQQFTSQQYTGTVGGQSTSFTVIDSEIKSTHLKNDSLAPPDFIGNSYQGLTWRLGYGIWHEDKPEEWEDHRANDSVPLSVDTVNRPEALWRGLAKGWWGLE